MKPPSRAPVYASMYPALAEIAREHGYALAIHGTMQRDFDLIACPWTEEARAPEVLMRAIAEAVAIRVGDDPLIGYSMRSAPRPHGREGWSILLERGEGRSDSYIDLSVMPLAPSPPSQAENVAPDGPSASQERRSSSREGRSALDVLDAQERAAGCKGCHGEGCGSGCHVEAAAGFVALGKGER